MNPRCQDFTFEVLNRFTRICLTCSFLLVTPRPNSVAATAGKYFTVTVLYALVTS